MPEMDPLDEFEAKQSFVNLAILAWTYYEALIEQGFTPEQALELVKAKMG